MNILIKSIVMSVFLINQSRSNESLIEFDEAKIENIEQEEKAIVSPAFQNPIHQSDLSSSSSPQYSIKTSGRYFLTSNISKAANGASDIILQINSSNVDLDLNNKTIAPHNSGSHDTGIGIALTKGLSNVSIMNGSINGDNLNKVQKLNYGIDLSNNGSGTSYKIKLQNLNILNCKLIGINGANINDLILENCVDSYCSNSGTADINAIKLTTIKNLNIQDCDFNHNSTSDGYCEAVKLIDCTNGIIKNISACNNSATNFTTGVSLDYSSSGCNNIDIKEINVSNNTCSAGVTVGLSILDSPLITVTNCHANNNSSSSVDSASGIAIFDSAANSNNCQLKNINANNNNSSADVAYGIYIESDSNLLEDISANNNTTSADANVAGIYLNGSNNNNLIKCNANRNNNSNTSSSSNANAYGIAIIGDNNSLKKCNTIGNTTSANAAVRAVGVYMTQGSNNRFEDCISNSNNASHTSASSISAGFELNSTEKRCQLIQCVANNNLAGDGTNSASGSRSYGIYLSSTTGADQTLVKFCNMQNNSKGSSGNGLAFGLYDNDEESTSLLIGNIAIGQGKCLGSTLNSSLQWNSNSEPSSNQNFFFKHPGVNQDPRLVIQEVPRVEFTTISTAIRKWQNISVY